MSKGGFMKDAVILCAITLVAGACLGGVYEMTKDPIAAANQAAKEAAYRTVFPDADGFEAADLADKLPAANETIATLGYGNVSVDEAVEATDGIQSDGTVNGIEFLTLAETAGLGMNAQKPEWKGQFAGKKADVFSVTKDGASSDDQINAISGATITSKAVTGAVNAAVYFVDNCLAQ